MFIKSSLSYGHFLWFCLTKLSSIRFSLLVSLWNTLKITLIWMIEINISWDFIDINNVHDFRNGITLDKKNWRFSRTTEIQLLKYIEFINNSNHFFFIINLLTSFIFYFRLLWRLALCTLFLVKILQKNIHLFWLLIFAHKNYTKRFLTCFFYTFTNNKIFSQYRANKLLLTYSYLYPFHQ